MVPLLADLFPGSTHVRDHGLNAGSDEAVWMFAAQNGFVIVSKDADFRQRSLVLGAPPKVVGLLLGNVDTVAVARTLRENEAVLRQFLTDATSAFLELP